MRYQAYNRSSDLIHIPCTHTYMYMYMYMYRMCLNMYTSTGYIHFDDAISWFTGSHSRIH